MFIFTLYMCSNCTPICADICYRLSCFGSGHRCNRHSLNYTTIRNILLCPDFIHKNTINKDGCRRSCRLVRIALFIERIKQAKTTNCHILTLNVPDSLTLFLYNLMKSKEVFQRFSCSSIQLRDLQKTIKKIMNSQSWSSRGWDILNFSRRSYTPHI